MPNAYEDAPSFFAALASMAEELRLLFLNAQDDECIQVLTRALTESDMVFGVWPDGTEPGGFGVQVIKGEHILPPLVGFETDNEIVVTAIPCVGLTQALDARDLWRMRVVDSPEDTPAAKEAAE